MHTGPSNHDVAMVCSKIHSATVKAYSDYLEKIRAVRCTCNVQKRGARIGGEGAGRAVAVDVGKERQDWAGRPGCGGREARDRAGGKIGGGRDR